MSSLRERIAEAAARWSLMYPIPAWQLLQGDRAEKLARSWGDGIADAVLATVQPELDARDAEITAMNDAIRKAGIEYPLGARGISDLADQRDGQRERAEEAEGERDRLKAEAREYQQANTKLQQINTWRTDERDRLREQIERVRELATKAVPATVYAPRPTVDARAILAALDQPEDQPETP